MKQHSNFTRRDLHGMWSGLPVPWNKNGGVDYSLLAEDAVRICKAGVHGIYSGGTTGEFYAQDFDAFRAINKDLIKIARKYDTFIQVGCTAVCTDEACKRVEQAVKMGTDAIQIALPFWLELDDDEVIRFFESIAKAAASTPIVHYDTIRSKRRISPQLYQKIIKRVPALWGIKFGGTDIWSVKRITMANPDLKVFVGEHILASTAAMGATGSYSSLVNLNPAWMLEYYEACRTKNWARAFQIQDEVAIVFMGSGNYVSENLQDSADDRILGQLAGFMKCPLYCKEPYRSGTNEDLNRLRAYVKEKLPHVLKLKGEIRK